MCASGGAGAPDSLQCPALCTAWRLRLDWRPAQHRGTAQPALPGIPQHARHRAAHHISIQHTTQPTTQPTTYKPSPPFHHPAHHISHHTTPHHRITTSWVRNLPTKQQNPITPSRSCQCSTFLHMARPPPSPTGISGRLLVGNTVLSAVFKIKTQTRTESVCCSVPSKSSTQSFRKF